MSSVVLVVMVGDGLGLNRCYWWSYWLAGRYGWHKRLGWRHCWILGVWSWGSGSWGKMGGVLGHTVIGKKEVFWVLG